MNNVALHSGMGAEIITHLRQFADLPPTGLMAGQAVASAVSTLYRDGSGVAYNDIDIFRAYSHAEEDQLCRGKRESCRAIDTVVYHTLEVTEGYAGLTYDPTQRYRVVKTTRDGMLNFVACEFQTRSNQHVLRTFDMNNVQVGVDLQSQKLVWTPAFTEFDQTHQLEIVSLHTPMQSLIRYFKKRQELTGVFGNDERMVELAAAAYYLELKRCEESSTQVRESPQVRWRFGALYKKRMDDVSSSILSAFDLSTEVIQGQPVYSLAPRFSLDTAFREVVELHTGAPQILPVVSRALREKHRKGMQERLAYVARQGRPTLTGAHWLVQGNEYLKANVTPVEMARLDAMTSAHHLSTLFASKSLAEQSRAAKLVATEVSRRGQWVYGVLENLSHKRGGPTAESLSAESLKLLLDEEEGLLSEMLAPPLLPDVEFEGYTVRDLTSGLALQDEGTTLHHCVAGYASSVSSGRCRIISFRRGTEVKDWLTLEVRRSRRGSWVPVQLKGLLNRNPCAAESHVAARYVGLLCLADWIGAKHTTSLWRQYPAVLWPTLQLSRFLGSLKSSAYQPSRVPKIVQALSRAMAHRLAKGTTLVYSADGRQCFRAGAAPIRFWLTLLHNKCRAPGSATVGFSEVDDSIPF